MARRKYRKWTLEQKIRILEEINEARSDSWGAVSDVLAKYGLNASHIQAFEAQLENANS